MKTCPSPTYSHSPGARDSRMPCIASSGLVGAALKPRRRRCFFHRVFPTMTTLFISARVAICTAMSVLPLLPFPFVFPFIFCRIFSRSCSGLFLPNEHLFPLMRSLIFRRCSSERGGILCPFGQLTYDPPRLLIRELPDLDLRDDDRLF